MCRLSPPAWPPTPDDVYRYSIRGPVVWIDAVNPMGRWECIGTVAFEDWPVLAPTVDVKVHCVVPSPVQLPLRLSWEVKNPPGRQF